MGGDVVCRYASKGDWQSAEFDDEAGVVVPLGLYVDANLERGC